MSGPPPRAQGTPHTEKGASGWCLSCPGDFGVRVAQVGISVLLHGWVICAQHPAGCTQSSSGDGVHLNDVTGPLQTTNHIHGAFFFRPAPRCGLKHQASQSGKKAPRAELSPASINHPASLWLKRQFTALGVIMMTVTFS